LIILDEADAMTRDAQNALRRVMEKYTENTRFCLICNYLSKIIPAIRSRCTSFRFGPLSTEQMKPRIDHVVKVEKLNVTDDGMEALVTLAKGDMRKALNVLQSTSMAHEQVNEDTVYTCTGNPKKQDIEDMLQWMLNENYEMAYRNLMKRKGKRGIALQDLLNELHTYVHRVDFPTKIRIHLIEKLSEIEYRLASGTNERLQTGSLVSAFQQAKEMATTGK